MTTSSISIFKSGYQTEFITGITEWDPMVFVSCETKIDNLAVSSISKNFDCTSNKELLKGENSHSKLGFPCCAVCDYSLLAGPDGITDSSRLLSSYCKLQFWWDTCIFWQLINLGIEMPFLPFSTNCIFICHILPNFCQYCLIPVCKSQFNFPGYSFGS